MAVVRIGLSHIILINCIENYHAVNTSVDLNWFFDKKKYNRQKLAVW